jgi:hypothetical protein
MTAKIDIKKSSRLKLDKNGYRAERIAVVTGVTGDPDEILFNAVNDGALPNIGDVHPVISAITLQNIQSEPLGGGQYRIVMSYFSDLGSESGSSNARFTANASTSSEETSRDINGVLMQTEYSVGGAFVSQYFVAELERPRMVFDFTYTAPNFPQSEIDNYVGFMNSVPWLGYAVNTILCSNIFVEDEGENFRVRFSFQYNSETWLFKAQTAYHFNVISAHPVRPDADLDLNTGTKEYAVFPSVDFTPLGFTFTGPRNFSVNAGAFRITGFDATLTVA